MFLVAIAGGSGSGKTTFAQKLLHQIGSPDVALIHQDSYYLPSVPAKNSHEQRTNFDHPACFDWPLLQDHLFQLKKGKSVGVPIYDFRESRRTDAILSIGPCQALILEGIYALWDEQIRELSDVRIFLNVEADIRFIRRLHRDAKERGRSIDDIVSQYYETVRPMHRKFLEPTKQFADIIVGEETDRAVELLATRVRERLRSHAGLTSHSPSHPYQMGQNFA